MIVCAALSVNTACLSVPVVISGLRHGDCYYQARLMNIPTNSENTVEGFVDNNGNFLDRFEAFEYAKSIGQLTPTVLLYKSVGKEFELYTEDLY